MKQKQKKLKEKKLKWFSLKEGNRFSEGILLVAGVFFAMWVGRAIGGLLTFLFPTLFQGNWGSLLYMILMWGLVLVALYFIIYYIRRRKLNLYEVGIKKELRWRDILMAFVGYLPYFLLSFALIAIFRLFSWFDATQAQDIGLALSPFALDRVAIFLSLVIVVSVGEEVVFRGVFYGRLRKILGFVPTTLIISVIFALFHGQWNTALDTFALSLVLCVLREYTGSVYPAIILHSLKNFIALLALFAFF